MVNFISAGSFIGIPFFPCLHVKMKGCDQFKIGEKFPVHPAQVHHFDKSVTMVADLDPVFFFFFIEKIVLHVFFIVFAENAPHSAGFPFMAAKGAVQVLPAVLVKGGQVRRVAADGAIAFLKFGHTGQINFKLLPAGPDAGRHAQIPEKGKFVHRHIQELGNILEGFFMAVEKG
jgi:hypothetical protein